LTPGEQFVDSLPKKTRFYDRNERRSYELTREIAARLVDDPSLLKNGLAYAKRHMSSASFPPRYLAMWEEYLRQDITSIVRGLLEDSPRGALLRDTQPVFCILPPDVRQSVIKRARSEGVTVDV
jgi:hypothetical protein